MSSCCQNVEATPRQRIGTLVGWILPTALLALMPKCPVCVAAYAAALTGIGLSLSAASFVRATIVVVCVTVLLAMGGLQLAATLCAKAARRPQSKRVTVPETMCCGPDVVATMRAPSRSMPWQTPMIRPLADSTSTLRPVRSERVANASRQLKSPDMSFSIP